MIIPALHSGLGNQLFQFASAYAYAKKTNRRLGLNRGMYVQSSHSNIDYRDTVFASAFAKYDDGTAVPEVGVRQTDNNYDTVIMQTLAAHPTAKVGLEGYFQIESLFRGYRNEIIAEFDIGRPTVTDGLEERGFFLHYRRGDYIGTTFEKPLDTYFRRCIARVQEWCSSRGVTPKFFIFSDDIEYCKGGNIPYLSGLDVEFIDPAQYTEIESLSLMSRCGLGGAAANSTFSWWGLYLNYERPLLFYPDCWGAGGQYVFPEVTVVESAAQ